MSPETNNDTQKNDEAEVAAVAKTKRLPRKVLYASAALIVVGLAVLVGFLLGGGKATAPAKTAQNKTTASEKKQPAKTTTEKKIEETTSSSCGSEKTAFRDESIGVQFCYLTSWGTASVQDAKVAASDTGHREVRRFSSNPYVIVGGMSDDWSTTVGRGVGCLEPDNVVPPLSAYDTSWHGLEGSGTDVSYAVRSLPSSVGGYSIQESVSDLLVSGVCVQGHKVISGSRYRVAAVNYARDFAPASGITTPAQHMAEPNVLFSTEMRTQYDAVLASLAAY